jgi:hypothetical protein
MLLVGCTFLLPDIEGVRPDLAIDTGCQLVSAGMEMTVNERVSGEEVLSLSGRFKPLHLPLSSSGWPMRVLGPII